MSKKRIENQFQKALGEYASIIDEDQLWNEIENRVPKKKKKKRFFLWIAFGLPALLFVMSVFWFASSNVNRTNDHLHNDTVTPEKIHLISESSISKSQNIENSISHSDQKENENAIIQKPITKSKVALNAIGKKTKDSNFDNEPISKNSSKENNSLSQAEMNLFNPNTNNKVQNKNTITAIQKLPILSMRPTFDMTPVIKIKPLRSQRAKRIKPIKKSPSFISLNYYAGSFKSAESKSLAPDTKYIHSGSPHFSQGISVSYNKFITSRLYAKAIIAGDKSYKKYTDQVQRDTLVPSSSGNQILTYNQYLNGVIDTEFGIPIVKGVLDHSVVNLNTISSLSLGLGLGYVQPLGKWNINLEADLQKTMYYDLSGLGREEDTKNIQNLDSFQNYFSNNSKLLLNAHIGLDFLITKSVFITSCFQYQHGLTSLVLEQTRHNEKIKLLRGGIGLKIYL